MAGDRAMSVDTVEVNRLLAASRAAHDMKKRSAGVIDKDGRTIAKPNYVVAERHLAEALRLRLDAHDLDPEHTASGWAQDRVPDAELIRFYVQYSRPLIPEAQMQQIVRRFPAYVEIRYIP